MSKLAAYSAPKGSTLAPSPAPSGGGGYSMPNIPQTNYLNFENIAFITGAVVAFGVWGNGGSLTMEQIFAGFFILLFLSIIDAFDSKLASLFAALILVSALLQYGQKFLSLFTNAKVTTTQGTTNAKAKDVV